MSFTIYSSHSRFLFSSPPIKKGLKRNWKRSKVICTYLKEFYCKLGDKTFVTHADKAPQPKSLITQISRQTTDGFIPPTDVPAAQVSRIHTSITAQQQQTQALESHHLTPGTKGQTIV